MPGVVTVPLANLTVDRPADGDPPDEEEVALGCADAVAGLAAAVGVTGRYDVTSLTPLEAMTGLGVAALVV